MNDEKVTKWREDIFSALRQANYVMDVFYSYDSNKQLLEHIALKAETYNFLNQQGLINRRFCPITGASINNDFSYNIYGRYIYLSKEGLDICHYMNRNEWKGEKIGYDEFLEKKAKTKYKSKRQATLIVLFLAILALAISWWVVNPVGFFSFLGFLFLSVVIFYVLGWVFNLLWDLYN